jgi:recombination endonuclease VII
MSKYDSQWAREYYIRNKDKIAVKAKAHQSKPEVKARTRQYGIEYRRINNERRYWNGILSRHGLTQIQWEILCTKQNGVCGICKQVPQPPQRLVVDHNHQTMVVRGLLCRSCNLILGQHKSNKKWFDAMESYLKLMETKYD